MWNNIQVLILLFPNTRQFQHSSINTEQFSTSVIIASAVMLFFLPLEAYYEDCLVCQTRLTVLILAQTVGTQPSSNSTNI